ncbi:MAG: glucan biosynthesis protein, partial [Pseudomonadota bacterium]
MGLKSGVAQSADGFSFASVVAEAEARASAPYVERRAPVGPFWQNLTYDQHRMIRFQPDQALWRDDRQFSLQFFHVGLFFDYPVAVNLVEDGQSVPLPFEANRFDYGSLDVPEDAGDPGGYAGFRVHFPINRADWADEFAVFLGASYFRLIGRDQAYGLSARGLAIDTAEPTAEEFPSFTDFWIEVPAPDANELTMMALLDSPSIAGAYRFRLRPGRPTVTDVD